MRRGIFLECRDGAHRLELVEADLLNPGTFDLAVFGCHTVFHTATPVHTLAAGDFLARNARCSVYSFQYS
jgi:hypothetical protein